jgi:hypothetical protein
MAKIRSYDGRSVAAVARAQSHEDVIARSLRRGNPAAAHAYGSGDRLATETGLPRFARNDGWGLDGQDSLIGREKRCCRCKARSPMKVSLRGACDAAIQQLRMPMAVAPDGPQNWIAALRSQ